MILGIGQISGATASAVLLLQMGMNPVSLGAVVITCALTSVSVILFGSRHKRHKDNEKHIEMRPGGSTLIAAIFVLLLWGFAGCGEPDPLQQEMLTLQDRSLPPGAMLVENTNLVRNGRTASAQWE